MNIGYDGKRAYQNKTGLGNYIRSLIAILTQHYPQHQYTLFAPKKTDLFDVAAFKNVSAIFPESFPGKQFPGWWRRRGMVKTIAGSSIDIYHGVSNELPLHIERTGVKTAVTIHDIIFERFPETYNFDERYVHRHKIKQACKAADTVIAISEQTKADLINFYKVPQEKIAICYQSCNPIFQQTISDAQKAIVKKRYQLPGEYFLFVSSIAPRKNLVVICKAMILLKDKLDIPLVVIGNGKKEKEEVRKLMHENGMANRLILLNELPASKALEFTTAADFPAIYQQALALIYPSIFEGFGAPLLEALWSGLPVISSNTSSLPEVGGDAALYFSPGDTEQLAHYMLQVASDSELAGTLRSKGFEQAQLFTTEKYADSIMKVYKQIL
ncbi:glycosyltransferase family 1 protein [Ferruginibacter paludis]|uniref:glycosyltransferase family 4 protein n=1 Tax=Ferruginibacter paludis TaxID=1310417 RepID=UPI0025B3E97B|nr:glycosyltransferase family 1 protein [Ferruginibacter paludis]MDN3655592.1 glycosyltransferase family 1 protein [Ferruginibacter paludis]